ncbi:MAG: TRAP transporter small permease [Deltaproteobacteria bacterium]|nr:TRAP transporter small permease [Deltaproteobacteria bacterium]
MSNRLSDSITVLNRFGRNLAGAGLLVMTALVTADVLLRRLFNRPIIFADEVSGYLLVLVTLLGVGYTLQENGHIQVTMMTDRLTPQKQAYLRILVCGIGLFYSGILLYLTGQVTWESFDQKSFSPTPSQMPLFPFQMVMPLGFLFLFFQLIIEIFRAVESLSSLKPTGSLKKD